MDKQAQLKKFKWFATMLLVFMAIIYIICETVFAQYIWAGYVKAFAEAGMVGALADWFAVTALFRHPLGIPIPHTNLIETGKQKIGNNLGNFVTSNFLTTDILRPRLQQLKIASRFGQWMIASRNRQKVTAELLRIINDALSKFNDEEITAIIQKQAEGLLERVPVNKLVADGLEKIIQDELHQDWLTTIAVHLRDLLEENRENVRKKVKEQSYFFVPGFVDNIIAEKITDSGIEYLEKFASQKNHPTRLQITQKLKSIAKDIQENGDWATRLNRLKQQLLSTENLHAYSGRLWQYIKKQIEQDLNQPQSAIGQYIDKVLYDMGESLANDIQRQERIDRFVQVQALRLITKYKESAGDLISQTVTNWPSKELSQKLELEVGKDLQYIRVNGTLVGGMVGLVIYTLTQLLH